MIKVGVIGATGFAGVELVRLLSQHPNVEVAALSSQSFEGKMLSDIYPAMYGVADYMLTNPETVIEKSDVVFASLPHGLSQETASLCDKAGKLFIDLGGDFRLESEEDYKEWYDGEFINHELHKKAVYGIPELFAGKIRQARIIANPGCYPTASILGIAPAISTYKLLADSVIIDAKSGVSGAGREPSAVNHFVAISEGFAPYKIGAHRHTPEIEQTLYQLSGEKTSVTFTPHLMPTIRGILATIYFKTIEYVSQDAMLKAYRDYYSDKQFVRVMPKGLTANTKHVNLSNYCNISVHKDERADRFVVISTIDNMMKGSASQAVQNMNIALGLDESAGISALPPAF